ncbi:MAG TPA: pyridoxine 5'-phosphate synthase [Candidatus Latescibacteria bacterium]|nr:pyridoxine 5'-phosphate synthase [Candidatus Latescibacterota bacterium]
MIELSVNVDKVATLRQSRGGVEPDPVVAAMICEQAGADGITVHLRQDRRHIQDRDVELLAKTIKTGLNLEMAAVDEMVEIALRIRPRQCTLVPERRGELTTEDGVDVIAEEESLARVVKTLRSQGIRVSIFSRLDEAQIKAAREVGADRIELFTGPYAKASTEEDQDREFQRLLDAARLARSLGLGINAGHDLDARNLPRVATIPNLREVSIGHSLISRAVFVGLERAVQELLAILRG